ncbi:helix-turn-helix domain-containing protein [Pseudoalteromonas sp.]|uniref:helix-turn-helix domain-containing protein n=1 Tax=Pseudoalteromonas sp. TaxID=53249 RepID=UPI00272BBA8C|nr:helix-turn-helix transcriptional regulator [Pseudoalteromonas sp.]
MGAFNQYLKTLRERKFLDIGKVAECTGVHRNTQSKYEDSRDPPFDYLVEFAALVDVPFHEIILKRLSDSKASDNAIQIALESLTADTQVKEINAQPGAVNVEISELSHTKVPVGSIACVNIEDKNVDATSLYCFKNPMTSEYFVSKIHVGSKKLKLMFESPEKKDLEFAIDSTESELKLILKTLGLVGKVIKIELNF